MTLPNILSFIRLLLVAPVFFLLLSKHKILAVVLIFIAWITDLLDGYFARKFNLSSNLGKTLDPLADKLLVLAIAVALLVSKIISLETMLVVISRDFIILLAGLYTSIKYKHILQSNYVGKISAFLIATILVVLLVFENNPYKNLFEILIIIIALVSLFLYSFYFLETLKKLQNQ
ncbi:MAG: CDP-alcohol phosphatidyltransferase family protein [Ignavibacteria bacterium]|nr:CDP-alcohol phosphatidyltransferase family protein [Ignavibacteria bacterium]